MTTEEQRIKYDFVAPLIIVEFLSKLQVLQ